MTIPPPDWREEEAKREAEKRAEGDEEDVPGPEDEEDTAPRRRKGVAGGSPSNLEGNTMRNSQTVFGIVCDEASVARTEHVEHGINVLGSGRRHGQRGRAMFAPRSLVS